MARATAEDLTLDPTALLATCLDRLAHGWNDLPMFASPCLTIAALCRRLLDAEEALQAACKEREQVENELRFLKH